MISTNKNASATLRIASKSLSSSEISKLFNVVPDSFYEKGDLISLRSPKKRYREETLLLYESKLNKEEPVEKHIDAIIETVESCKKGIIALTSSCDIEIYCMFSMMNDQGGFVLSKEVMKKLSALEIDVVFDIYHLDK